MVDKDYRHPEGGVTLLNRHFKTNPQEFAPAPQNSPIPAGLMQPLEPTADLGRKHKRPVAQTSTTAGTAAASAVASTPAAIAATSNAMPGGSPTLTACSVMSGAHSVTGSRQKNEDSYLIDAPRHLWAVSDGIGGAPFGEVISRVCCNYAARAWDASLNAPSVEERLQATIAQIDAYASDLSDLLGHKGSGATFTLAHYDGRLVTIASVGDTKAFLLHEGALTQISADGRVSSLTNALDQALGYHLNLRPAFASFEPHPGDVLALCTDGVWSTQTMLRLQTALQDGHASSQQIATDGNPQHMAYSLVEGSDMSDNATAVVVLFDRQEEFALFTPTLA